MADESAYAQDAEMSLEEFQQYVFATTYADTPKLARSTKVPSIWT